MKFLTIGLASLFLFACGKTGDLTKPEAKQEAQMEAKEMKLSTDDSMHKKYDLDHGNDMKQETMKTSIKPMVDDSVKKYTAPQFDTGMRPTSSK